MVFLLRMVTGPISLVLNFFRLLGKRHQHSFVFQLLLAREGRLIPRVTFMASQRDSTHRKETLVGTSITSTSVSLLIVQKTLLAIIFQFSSSRMLYNFLISSIRSNLPAIPKFLKPLLPTTAPGTFLASSPAPSILYFGRCPAMVS